MQTISQYDKPSLGVIKTWIMNFRKEFNVQMRDNVFLIALCFGSYALVYFMAFLLDFKLDKSMTGYLNRALLFITPILIYFYLVLTLLRVVFIDRPQAPVKVYLNTIWPSIIDPKRFARVIPLLLIATFGFFAFVQFKLMIPEFIPFYADQAFVKIDRFIHFGRLPNEWLTPLINWEWAVHKIDFIYKLWYFPMFLIWGWAAWGTDDNGWRRQYVLAFMLCWILGGVILATLLSSVGPCFFEDIVNSNSPYSEQMAVLKGYDENESLLAIMAQTALLDGYLNPEGSPLRAGISAMPSLHNTIAMLFVIVGYKINRLFGHATLVFAIIILIGSIVLGWHYAIDGYFGFVLAIAMWKLAGWILKTQDQLLNKPLDVTTAST